MTERLSPEELLAATLSAFQKEPASHILRSEVLVKDGHSLEDPHDSAATHKRMAEVYRSTAEKLGITFKQFRRDLERAMNPNFKDYSDAKIDLIIEKHDRIFVNMNDHHGALT